MADINTFSDKDYLRIPRNLRATQPTPNNFKLTWEAPTNNINTSGYNVYLAFDPTLQYQLIGFTSGLNYIFSGLDRGRQYYFAVTSLYSGSAPSIDYVPQNVRTTLNTGVNPPNIQITWSGVTNLVSSSVVSTNVASGTIALFRFENNLLDSGIHGHTLEQAGTLRYNTSTQLQIPEGVASAGPFSNVGYATGTQPLLSALSNLNAWSFEFLSRSISRANNPKLLSWVNETGENYISLLNSPAGSVKVSISGDSFTVSKSAIDSNIFSLGLTYDGSNVRIYLDNLLLLTTGVNGYTGTVTGLYVGTSYSGVQGAYSGFLDGLRFSDHAKTKFPTIDNFGPSGIPTSTVSLYRFENNFDDETNNYPLVGEGNLFFSSSVVNEGSYSVGNFRKENYISGTESLNTVLSTFDKTYTFELRCYLSGTPTTMSLFSFSNSGLEQDFRVVTGSGLQWRAGNATIGMGTNVLNTGWNDIAFSFDGVNRRSYVNGVLKTVTSSNPSNSYLNNIQSFTIGKNFFDSSLSRPFSGFIDYFRISNRLLTGLIPSENYITYGSTTYSIIDSPVSGYKIWRSDTWDGPMSGLAITTGLSYIDSGVNLNTSKNYYYRVTSLY